METHSVADLVFTGSGRWVTAIDRFSGRPVWRQKLPRLFGFVTLMVDGNELFVGRGGYVYCLDARTGQTLWERGVGPVGSAVLMTTAGQGNQQAIAATVLMAQEAAATESAAAAAAAT